MVHSQRELCIVHPPLPFLPNLFDANLSGARVDGFICDNLAKRYHF